MTRVRPDPGDEALVSPRDFESFRAAIDARKKVLPKRLAAVARYVLNNPDDVALSTAADIAAAAEVTPSTLIRFAQLFGYNGFSALQVIFRDEIRMKISGGHDRGYPTSLDRSSIPEAEVFRRTMNACHSALDALSNAVTVEDIQIAAQLLFRAKYTFIMAKGSTLPIAVALQHALARSRIQSALLADIAGGEDHLACARPGDAAVIIANGSDTEQLAASASALLQRDVSVIAITDSVLSSLSEQVSVCFSITDNGPNAAQLTLAGIALSQMLASCATAMREEQAGAD